VGGGVDVEGFESAVGVEEGSEEGVGGGADVEGFESTVGVEEGFVAVGVEESKSGVGGADVEELESTVGGCADIIFASMVSMLNAVELEWLNLLNGVY
jgi:hypothetical protein